MQRKKIEEWSKCLERLDYGRVWSVTLYRPVCRMRSHARINAIQWRNKTLSLSLSLSAVSALSALP